MAESAADPSARRPRVLLCLSGSVACVKAPELASLLLAWADVRCVATPSALRFLPAAHVSARSLASGRVPLLTDEDEWSAWSTLGDPVLHIELRRWADVLLLAPLGAHTLSVLAHGGAQGLVACVARAWEWGARPVVVAPAMNTAMWDHPFTAHHLAALAGLGAVVVPPAAKRLACGDVGVGAMASAADVDAAARLALAAAAPRGDAAEAGARTAGEVLARLEGRAATACARASAGVAEAPLEG